MKTPRLTQSILSLGLLLLLLGLAGCPSTKVIFPPIATDAARLQTPGKFVWFDLYTTDMTACENFYEPLFGWEFERTNDNNPRVKTIWHQSIAIGNMIGREAEPGDSLWLSYLSSTGVDATLKAAEESGGSIYRDAQDLPDRGRIGVAVDPQGGAFGVLTSPNGDPHDTGFTPNRWMGSELWTTDVDGATAFYTGLAGFEVEIVNVHDKVQYRVLRKDGKRRGGIVSIPWDNMKPEWIPYIAVADVPSIVARVPELGGKVLVQPDMSVVEGRLAIIADPSGAVFGIHQLR